MLITDPDQITQGVEVIYDTDTLSIALAIAGNLTEDGVTGQCFYSFTKEEWLSDPELIKYTFPMLAITPEQFEIGNNGSRFSNWKMLDDDSRKLIRTAGWAEYNSGGEVLREHVGTITLGSIDAVDKTEGDRAQYFFSSDSAATEFTYAGAVNEAIQIFGDVDNGDFDKRGDVLTVIIRVEGKTYGQSTTTDIGVGTMTYKVERFPLSETPDNNISITDSDIDSTGMGIADVAPFDGMSITYIEHQNQGDFLNNTSYAAGDVVLDVSDSMGNGADKWYITADGGVSDGDTVADDAGVVDWTLFDGQFEIGAQWYAFGVVIDGNNAASQQIYEFVQWSLRQNTDIDAGTNSQIGILAESLLNFSAAPTMITLQQSDSDGVFITNFDSNVTNDLQFQDDTFTNVVRTFPFKSAGKLLFNTNIVNDTDAKYWMFYKDAAGKLINTPDAIIVKKDNGDDISGLISGAVEVGFDFDYDGNDQGGRVSGADAVVVVRVQGLNTTQFVEAEFTISRATGQNFPVTGALERNYLNAVA